MYQPEASIAIQVLPLGADDHIVPIVDKVIEYLKSTGNPVHVGPFETTVEGDFERLMEIIREAQLICIREGAPSVASYIKIFYYPHGGLMSIERKISKHQE